MDGKNCSNIINQLPKQFQEFLEKESIDLQYFIEPTNRYIRIKPQKNITIDDLKQTFPQIQPVIWNDNLYSIPVDVKISNCELYQKGLIYGIDLSSAAVVQSMELNQDDYNVLEICCAPGAKLTYIGDQLSILQNSDQRKLVGIDINKNRLNIANALVQKYKLNDIIDLVLADGTQYDPGFQFDKVLLDAECTHEGSLKHLKKFINSQDGVMATQMGGKKYKKNQKQSTKQLKTNHTNKYLSEQVKKNEWSYDDFMSRFLDQKKLDNIVELQWQLLNQAFKLTKKGGQMVYSTCSFSQKQNEELIQRFIDQNGEWARLVHPFAHINQEERSMIPYRDVIQQNAIRFDPQISNSGGMFIAKIQKL